MRKKKLKPEDSEEKSISISRVENVVEALGEPMNYQHSMSTIDQLHIGINLVHY